MNTKHKVAIVTGAGRGIGKACAITLLQNGWHTVFVGRTLASLKDAVKEAGNCSALASTICCDVSQADQVEGLFEQVINQFGRVDLLFNNAGVFGPAGTIDDITFEDWQNTLDTNLCGAFNCARSAFSAMRKQTPQGGRIINNGSIAAQSPRPKTVPYTVTKHAINGLTKCLSLDGREFNIACGQIDIGNVLTEMTVPMTEGMAQANGTKAIEPVFDMQQVVESVLCMAKMPLSANVQSMTVMATNMPFIGRG